MWIILADLKIRKLKTMAKLELACFLAVFPFLGYSRFCLVNPTLAS
ncbi:hypothetical protein SMIDD26_01850 [Streptococcus mitis]|uniref:Uncharacterized protein n=1 Tax=Streptococcus mitis TaxID=28037 RepID=A0A139PKS3_STRMT|nr:hypothetical protein SMIDD26_01850 [Streptococcus mitis]